MSKEHPIVAITGPSGAGTTTITSAFQKVFMRNAINATFVEGESFRRHDREAMREAVARAEAEGRSISHYGPEANLFDRLEALFEQYGRDGTGQIRHYVTDESAARHHQSAGTFTPWEDIPQPSDMLFYEGMHGGVVARNWSRRKMSPSHNPRVVRERRRRDGNNGVDVAQHVDLLIGVIPSINLEWIQKIHRDISLKAKSVDQVKATILRMLRDYTHFITPQFSVTDINFQRIPIVDTSNPFTAMDVPSSEESMMVVRFRDPDRYDFPYMISKIHKAHMTRPNTLLIPGREFGHALEVICGPLIAKLIQRSRRALEQGVES